MSFTDIEKYNVLVVGCGLSGASVARMIAEKGYKVLIVERRNHIGGNMYDYYDEHGILVHKYGPHTFHTNDKTLYDFICRFSQWDEYKLTCGAEINGICTPTPFNFRTIDDFYSKSDAEQLKRHIAKKFPGRQTATVVELLDCDDDIIRGFAQFLFENDYSLYTAKQWGVDASEIDPSVLKRVPIRFGYEVGYFDDKYQVMPKTTYVDFFSSLLEHDNIDVVLGFDMLDCLSVGKDDKKLSFNGKEINIPVVYTGPLDELFLCRFGALPYRSLRFDWKYENIDSKQDMPVVAYPQAEGYTRIVEYKKLPYQNVNGTTYEVEYSLPYKSGEKAEPYYPVLTEESMLCYEKYRSLAEKTEDLFLCGRLADFKYYNMDQALKKALEKADIVLEKLSK